MLKIIFNNNVETQASFKNVKNGVVQLMGENVNNLNGFKAYKMNDKFLGDYSEYTTKYNIHTDLEDGIMLSTGEVEKEVMCDVNFSINGTQGSLTGETSFEVSKGTSRNEIIVPTVVSEENYEFIGWNPRILNGNVVSNENYQAQMEYVPTLSEVIEAKVTEMNEMQQLTIQAGVDVALTDGTVEHFELTDHDQASLTGLQTQVLAGVEQLPWHTSDNAVQCKYYTNADMLLITSSAMGCVTYHVTYFRDLRIMIRDMEDKATVNAVTYGMYIPVEYQSEVLKDLYKGLGITNE